MIFVTGDTHADVVRRFKKTSFPEQKEMTKDDFVIILGDFGLVWDKEESKHEKTWLDWLEDKPFTVLFIDGNHENFDRLNSYPVEEWHGGMVHKIRPHVIHLMRGYVFELQGNKFFTFGGARSHDIKDGILDKADHNYRKKKRELDRRWALYRINHVSWWAEEMPNEEEMKRGVENLGKFKNDVDFILTHDMPRESLLIYSSLYGGFRPEIDELEEYLDNIRLNTRYKHWFCGHYHDERNITPFDAVIYEQIVRIV